MEPPPWRWRAFSKVTLAAGYNDTQARELFMSALLVADGENVVERAAETLGVSKRTLQRARDWLKDHAPEEYARLKPRTTGVLADPRAAAARRKDRQ